MNLIMALKRTGLQPTTWIYVMGVRLGFGQQRSRSRKKWTICWLICTKMLL